MELTCSTWQKVKKCHEVVSHWSFGWAVGTVSERRSGKRGQSVLGWSRKGSKKKKNTTKKPEALWILLVAHPPLLLPPPSVSLLHWSLWFLELEKKIPLPQLSSHGPALPPRPLSFHYCPKLPLEVIRCWSAALLDLVSTRSLTRLTFLCPS